MGQQGPRWGTGYPRERPPQRQHRPSGTRAGRAPSPLPTHPCGMGQGLLCEHCELMVEKVGQEGGWD
eukprot:6175882-Prorocentrum_lima.AAC.1